ncbi:DUF427 domain-containing protein [Crateriforma spongiae]|uniref:DUF427 domain-containing protein n=1 Tax=Crateriforma spongiae TaxID=2724528 RepID=UPI00144635BB|nr:DUF427 domain-containing protein [Crateriforma spongiae]
MRPTPDPVGPGQESVWDYPRPPALQPAGHRLRIVHAGQTIAETMQGFRVLETSHPPTYYFPPGDCRLDWMRPAGGGSFCEWKGPASYLDLKMPGGVSVPMVAWFYADPTKRFAPIARFLAFYASKVDECYVGDWQASPQPGGFYGGWVTPNLAGPFKGGPGSMGW